MLSSCKFVLIYINTYICEACSVQPVNLESSSNKKSLTSENIHTGHVRTQCSHGTNELLEVFLDGKKCFTFTSSKKG